MQDARMQDCIVKGRTEEVIYHCITHLRLPEFQIMTSHDYGMYTEVII